MKCKDIERDLILYYYDEIEPSAKAELKAHLESCDNCMSSWERLKDTLDAAKVKELDLPDSFWQRYRSEVYEKIEGKKSFSPFKMPRFAPAAVMALILFFAVFGGIKLYESKQDEAFISKNYELIKNLEVLEDVEILQHLEEIEAQGEI